jgi:Cerato-platanin
MIFPITFILALLLTTHVAHALPPHAEHSARQSTLKATFDTTYDNPSGSLNSVACSNGANGLAGIFPTFGDIPSFPFIGGAPGIVWNSPNCGSCWQLVSATGAYIFMTAIDSAATFNIAQEAFEVLNGGQVGQGELEVFAEQVPLYLCGL